MRRGSGISGLNTGGFPPEIHHQVTAIIHVHLISGTAGQDLVSSVETVLCCS